jgi:hypothetical protein
MSKIKSYNKACGEASAIRLYKDSCKTKKLEKQPANKNSKIESNMEGI